jgi:catalase (peroxidase I)
VLFTPDRTDASHEMKDADVFGPASDAFRKLHDNGVKHSVKASRASLIFGHHSELGVVLEYLLARMRKKYLPKIFRKVVNADRYDLTKKHAYVVYAFILGHQLLNT